MKIFAVLIVILVIVGVIGEKNIVGVLLVGASLFFVGWFLLNKYLGGVEKREADEKKELKIGYYNTKNYFDEGYEKRPTITGDYFRANLNSQYTDTYETLSYCQYANTANCANCQRRKEHQIDNQYFYGVSYDCKERRIYDYEE